MPFKNESDPETIAKTAAVADAYTEELYQYLLTLIPTPQGYRDAHNRHKASYTESLTGGPDMVKACEADREAIDQQTALIQGVAKAFTGKDPKVPEILGLSHAADRTNSAAAILLVPHEFKVVYDPTGQLKASCSRVEGAKGYQVWACEGDPNSEENWRMLQASSTCRSIAINGLDRTKPNWLKIRATRGNQTGPWSNFVSLPRL